MQLFSLGSGGRRSVVYFVFDLVPRDAAAAIVGVRGMVPRNPFSKRESEWLVVGNKEV